jgi:CRP/FNR family cyclic AMP-dependent transcriptional regulator
LRERTREEFLALGFARRHPQGKTILAQGDRGTFALLLLSGWVKVIGADSSGETALLAIRAGGDLVGEMGVLDHATRSASVVTCTDLVVRQIAGTEFERFLARHPDAAIEVASMISERFRWANRRRVEFATCPADVRVARILLDLCSAYGRIQGNRGELDVALTRDELASMAGVALSTAEKIVRSYQREGLVSSRYRALTVTDLTGLRRRAGRP